MRDGTAPRHTAPLPSDDPRLRSSFRARAAIILAACLWSTGGAAIKLSHASAPQLAAGRAVIAAIVLFLFFKQARIRWNRNVYVTAAFYALTCTLFVFANTLTTAGNTIFIQNTAPIWVLLISPRWLKEPVTPREKVSVPISVFGCLLFFLDDMSAGRTLGNACAAAASLTYAMLIVCYRMSSEREGLAATVAGNAMITLVMAPFAFFTGPTPAPEDLLVFFYLGAIQQAVSAVVFVRGIRGASAMEGALLILFEPLLSPLWAYLLIGEGIGPIAGIGALLVIGAAAWRAFARPRRRSGEPVNP